MLAFLTAAPGVAVRPRPSLVESSFSIHALAVQASPEPSPVPSPLPAANTDATGMCGLELVYTPVGLSGAIEAFAFRADGKIVHSHARSASAAVWTPFRPVGDEDGAETRKFASGPTVVRAADGRLEVVARGMDGALYVKYQLAPNGVRGWGPWVRVDGGPAFAGVPSAVLSAEGFLQLFARSASSGEIMYNGQLRNASGVYWSGWQSLGGAFASGPWAVLDAESLLHVRRRAIRAIRARNSRGRARNDSRAPLGARTSRAQFCALARRRRRRPLRSSPSIATACCTRIPRRRRHRRETAAGKASPRSTAASRRTRASRSSSTAPTCSRCTRRAPTTARSR